MKQVENSDLYVDRKHTIHFRVTMGMIILGTISASLMAFLSLISMTIGSSYLSSGNARRYVPFVASSIRAALDKESSSKELAEKIEQLSYLDNIDYVALLDAQGKALSEWHRPGAKRDFSSKFFPKIEEDTLTRFGTSLYIKEPLNEKNDYYLLMGIDPIALLLIQLTQYGSFYLLFFVGAFVVILIANYFANVHLVKPLTGVCKSTVDMLEKRDLTFSLPIAAGAEIGKCTLVINTIAEKLRTMLLALRKACEQFEEVVKNLEESGNNVSKDSLVIKQNIDNTNDKMSELDKSFWTVTEELQKLTAQSERSSTTVYEMGQVNEEVFENVTAMSAAVTQSIGAIEQMSAAIEQTSGFVDQLNTDIESVNESMRRLDSSIALEQKSATDSIDLSKELAQNADNGMAALEQTIGGIDQIQKNSAEIAKVVATFEEHAMNIGNILHVIDDVTKQTNLLALNAAIISAQAGEHGRGFAVVAEEIGALASRTKDSTKEIAELIEAIQNETRLAVSVMQENNSTIENGAKLGAEAAKAFAKLKNSADKSTAQAQVLAKATAEQVTDVKNVTQAIGSIVNTVSEMNRSARRQAEEADLLNKAAGNMNMLNQQVARSSEEQSQSAKEVLKSIKNISQMAEAVNKRQTAQTAGTKLAVSTIGQVDECVKLQNEAARRLTKAIEEIGNHIGKLTSYTAEFKI